MQLPKIYALNCRFVSIPVRSVLSSYGLFNTGVDRLSYRARKFLQEVIAMKTKTGVKAGNSSYFVEWIPNN